MYYSVHNPNINMKIYQALCNIKSAEGTMHIFQKQYILKDSTLLRLAPDLVNTR